MRTIIIKVFTTVLVLLLFSHVAIANVVGTDAQNFNPTPDGLDYVTVFSSETLEPGIFNLGLFLNYAENTFPAFEGTGQAPNQSLLDKNDSLSSADLNFALGIFPNLQIGISLPYIINQTIDNDQGVGSFDNSGFTEYRGSLKYRLKKRNTEFMPSYGIATVVSFNVNRIRNNPYVGDDPGPTYNLEFVIDRLINKWSWAANFGYRWRDPGEALVGSGIEPFPSQWIASTAVSRMLADLDTKLIFEIYGNYPAKEVADASDRQSSSLEFLGGLKHDYNKHVALHVGGGTELSHGTSTPDWRVYVGLNYVIGPVFESGRRYSETKTKKGSRITSTNLNFATDEAELTPKSQIVMAEIVERLKSQRNDIRAITVLGHTDSVGPAAYNQGLSKRRAHTVRKIIVRDVPLPANKVFARGYGEEKPIANNGNYQGRRKNRRVELDIEK